MFAKPLHKRGTLFPLRMSQWKQLRARIASEFIPAGEAHPEDMNVLAPEGLFTAKFARVQREPGIMYISQNKDPLWITFGHDTVELILTVYTLWKRPILPVITILPEAMPTLIKGTDLGASAVMGMQEDDFPLLATGELVGIAPYGSSVPLAVGRMAQSSKKLNKASAEKVVHVVHTIQDCLWSLGSKETPPEAVPPFTQNQEWLTEGASVLEAWEDDLSILPEDVVTEAQLELTPGEVDTILRNALLQAILSLAESPPGTFPIPVSVFYCSYILPSRPARCSLSCDIKRSSFKKVSRFIHTAEKEGLLKAKEIAGELNITGVVPAHEEVLHHDTFETIGDVVEASNKAAARKAGPPKAKVMVVDERYRPHSSSIPFFKAIGKPPEQVFTIGELHSILEDYVLAHSLFHEQDNRFIRVDATLSFLRERDDAIGVIRREKLVSRLTQRMKHCRLIKVDGRGPVTSDNPISITAKRARNGSATHIKDFEPFSLTADFLCTELRKLCASTASVTRNPRTSEVAVLVRGRHIRAVTSFLISQGVPASAIISSGLKEKEQKRKKIVT
ncbi:hypothetical protein BOTBODRAFT_186179 [Botryobasidium botryosum FD-172 SS1]|uniref:SUI1 domain-containing protein n=1 Tax=Botryobasidium botryosum (strain FD-172 SS1) TaxID=930990 RepID=A0A067MZN6_BOTB1|nr:hypothetical protein BOTBODRAFT_186179 [Botryobasidium botryosum FD-172 SS1]